MRVIIYSHVFLPNYGGSGQVARMLAEGFVDLGHEVTVVTETPGPARTGRSGYRLHRGFSWWRYFELARNADAVLLISISLKALLPALLARRRIVTSHQMMAGRGYLNTLKRFATRLGTNVASSGAVAQSFGFSMPVIGNPYDDAIYSPPSVERRDRDFAFVGRVIDCKGLHILVAALAQLRDRGRQATLTVIGDGDSLSTVQQQVADHGLVEQVVFTGPLDSSNIARRLHEHRAIVVPSLWDEPFGIVALEGMACGCIPIIAESGGLPEATGGFGLTYPRHDATALVGCLERVLNDQAFVVRMQREAATHLSGHTKKHVAAAYAAFLNGKEPVAGSDFPAGTPFRRVTP